jgi:hypothetical protein
MGGLQPGESLGGVDLYAAASLPPVGQRPVQPAGDLWHRIQPCWRPAGHSPVELVVALGPDGQLIGDPMALRRRGAPPDAVLAERSAVRATQACAPFTGLAAGKWRVGFSGGS